jgi:predicted DNA-binding transcriptional regulator YafY
MLLVNRNKIQAKELADIFEVSVRTIYRDIEIINQAGIPVVTYPGANGGLGLIDSYRIDKNILGEDDIVSILRALRGLESSVADQKLMHVIEKIIGLVPKHQIQKVEGKCNQVVIDFSGWEVNDDFKEKLGDFKKAIDNYKAVSFQYIASSGMETERTVEPVQIHFKERNWYLHGFCRLRNDYRFFKLSRIKNLKCLEWIFQPHDTVGMVHYQDEWSLNTVELLLKFSQRVRARVEEFFDAKKISYADNGEIYVTVMYPEDEWVYGFILSFGEDVEVIRPEHIKQIIREKAAKIVNLYAEKET